MPGHNTGRSARFNRCQLSWVWPRDHPGHQCRLVWRRAAWTSRRGRGPLVTGSEAIRCKKDACLLRPYPDRPGAMLARGAQHPDFCAQISVTVSAEPARGLCPRPWPQLVDRLHRLAQRQCGDLAGAERCPRRDRPRRTGGSAVGAVAAEAAEDGNPRSAACCDRSRGATLTPAKRSGP